MQTKKIKMSSRIPTLSVEKVMDSVCTKPGSHDIPLTPASPSSTISHSTLNGVTVADSPFRGIALAFWDNILGPRTRHVWNINPENPLRSQLLSLITSQVLSCEICRDPYKSEIDFKFYNLPHKDVVVPSFVFSAKGQYGISVHALYVVLSITELKFYVDIHETLQCCFHRLARKLRVILEKVILHVILILNK